MKKIVKLLAIIFMVASSLGTAITAFAEPAGRPASGTLHIHKFLGKEMNDANYPNDGTEIPGGLPDDRVPLTGVKFNVYEILEPTGENPPPYPPPGNLNAADADKWSYSRTDLTLTVTGKGANDGEIYTYTLGTAVSQETEDGVVSYPGLSGYYYVEEDVANSTPTDPAGDPVVISRGMDPFIVAVPMWHVDKDDNGTWLTDVHVYPKNKELGLEKTPEKPSVEIGEEFNWYVKADIPDEFENEYTKFWIWDQFDYRLDYLGVPKVEGGSTDANGNWTNVIDLVEGAGNDYTLEVIAADPTGQPPLGAKVTVKLTTAGIQKLGTTAGVEQLRVTFRTKSNKYVEGTELINNDIPNEATVEFTNDDGDGKDTTPETKVEYGTIEVDKKDDKNGTLKGSEFQLADTEANANAEEFMRVTLTSDNKIASILRPGDTGYDTATPWIIRPHAENSALGLIDGAYYSAAFRGLTIGELNDATPPVMVYRSYWLVETKTPANHNPLEDPVKVEFSADTTNNLIKKEIVNKRGFTLPETGSLMTLLLTIFGIILIGFAIITMNSKKKKA